MNMAERISYAGTHKARAVEFDFDASNGKECIVVRFEFTDGPHKGKSIQWWGYFMDAAVQRTLDSLRHCGWTGETLGDMTGMGDAEVELVVEDQEYNGKVSSKVRWVNRPARLMVKNAMSHEQMDAFSKRMARLTADSKRNYGAPPAKAAAATSNGGASKFSFVPADPGCEYPPDESDVPF
jgi:hypothetical protein